MDLVLWQGTVTGDRGAGLEPRLHVDLPISLMACFVGSDMTEHAAGRMCTSLSFVAEYLIGL